MMNYYEKLNLDSSASAEEISGEIAKLERTWLQRIMQQPEKAQEMLLLISEAKPLFGSDEAKKEYDATFQKVDADNNPGDARTENYEKWYSSAREFFDTVQYDLSKTALEKAMDMSIWIMRILSSTILPLLFICVMLIVVVWHLTI